MAFPVNIYALENAKITEQKKNTYAAEKQNSAATQVVVERGVWIERMTSGVPLS